jgi:hypothetical protein
MERYLHLLKIYLGVTGTIIEGRGEGGQGREAGEEGKAEGGEAGEGREGNFVPLPQSSSPTERKRRDNHPPFPGPCSLHLQTLYRNDLHN